MTTFNLGLIGYPIKASLSPHIHRAALKEAGLDGDYQLYPIHPDDKNSLSEMLTRVRTREIDGLNVTIPHKQNIIPLIDKLSESVQIIGAVNTISLKDGLLIGDNTDAPGFWNDLQSLLAQKESIQNKNALIFGAGGAARSIAHALLNKGWDITLATRYADIEQAQTFKSDFLPYTTKITTCLLNQEDLAGISPALIVNTTHVGMKSHREGTPWVENLPFPQNAILYDVIYTPAQTQLIQDAAKAGLPTRSGLGMLIGQALLSFEIWTGKIVSTENIQKHILRL